MRFKLPMIFMAILSSLVFPVLVQAQERQWQLDAQGEDAFLVFGVPNTADIGISVWCKIGQKDISVFAPVPKTVKSVETKVTLEIGGREYPLKAKLNIEGNNATVESELEPRDELFLAISTTERIGLIIGNHKSVFPTDGADFFEFNKLCTTMPAAD